MNSYHRQTSAISLCNKTHPIMLVCPAMLSMILSSLFCNICNVSAILLTVLPRPQNGHMRFEQNKGLLIFFNVFCPLFSIPHPAPEIGLKYSQTLNIYSFLPVELIFYPTLERGLECCNSFHLSILALERYIIERRVLHLMRKIPCFSINFQATLTAEVH